VYTAVAGVYARPDVLPPTGALFAAARSLVTGHVAIPAGEHAHASDHTAGLVEQGVTLQGALLVTFLRAVFGAGVGSVLGILLGLWMGWSRRADHYLHPVYVLSRSVPPLALITYVMLWFGHGQVHLLIPIAYAVAVTAVIPAYHGMLDLGEIHLKAARALGARGWLLWSRVVLPAVTPFVLSGLRYALFVAWMTAVGAEMLMADDGIGHLLVDGGLWSSRLEVRVDPAVVMVGIVGVASVGYAMDLTARVVSGRMTAWMRRGR
jgi:ABC-type nitrate/sulfonate/bicarbonate transport system permease component